MQNFDVLTHALTILDTHYGRNLASGGKHRICELPPTPTTTTTEEESGSTYSLNLKNRDTFIS